MMQAVLLAAVVLCSGCAQPDPVMIEVFANPGTSEYVDGNLVYRGQDGERSASGECGSTVEYQAHVSRRTGSVDVTVTDGAGRETQIRYEASTATREGDLREVEGTKGTWTVAVRWTGFAGAIHAGITC